MNKIINKWMKMSSVERMKLNIKLLIWLFAFTIVFLAVFGHHFFGPNSAFSSVFDSDTDGFDMIGSWIDVQIPTILKSIVFIVVALVISKILSWVIMKFLLISKRGITAAKLIESFIKYFTAIVIIIMILLIFGVDSLALFASVGILGLIVGLSAQSLISDIISGVFIVFENQYQVGDLIIIDTFRGQVMSIGIRTTQLIDAGGNIKVINNSEIKTIINLSASPSLAVVEVSIHYDDFLRADQIFKTQLSALKPQLPKFIDGPTYIGPIEFADAGIQVKFIGKVDETDRYQAERDLRTALKAFMDQHQIEIPYPRMVVVNKETMNR